MQIQQISVNGLFGTFDHVIPLNIGEKITIIHGPNGFGKTIILKMLDGFFNSNYSVFKLIPFTRFQIKFDDGSNLDIERLFDVSDRQEKQDSISVCFNEVNNEIGSFPFQIPSTLSKKNTLMDKDKVEDLNDQTKYLFDKDNRPEWLKKLTENIQIRLIESQRLLSIPSQYSQTSDSVIDKNLQTVLNYASEIAQLIQAKLTEYGTTSQALDRTFPTRVVQFQKKSDLTEKELLNQLNDLEQTRLGLIKVGLLDQEENLDFQIPAQTIDESTKNLLSVYAEDVEQKLSVFNEIANKFALFQRIINKKFAYSYKEMHFDKEKGFVFKTQQHHRFPNQETIAPTDLSSGEQHELVLLYELLFKVKPKTLVLIDEPELSLHVGWQVQFLKDLQEITKLADIDILMATHSPDIIQDRWDLTVELKDPAA